MSCFYENHIIVADGDTGEVECNSFHGCLNGQNTECEVVLNLLDNDNAAEDESCEYGQKPYHSARYRKNYRFSQ